MRLLFIGDIFGSPGRRAITRLVPGLRRELELDFVIANGENAVSGAGLNPASVEEILGAGVDVITGGNHGFDKAEGIPVIDREPRVLRPINYPPGTPGRGVGVYAAGETKIAVISVMGRIFMQPLDCPFRGVDTALEEIGDRASIVFVDFHAEATSEKIGLGWYLDGRVSAVVGTHTHVQTADEKILPRGTAHLTDAGMTGPHDSIIGTRKELALQRMLAQMPVRFQPAERDVRLHGALIDIDPDNGRARSITRIARLLTEE